MSLLRLCVVLAVGVSKPIEFTIPCHVLCEFESVKNFTRLDGRKITFIEKSAADKVADAADKFINWKDHVTEAGLDIMELAENLQKEIDNYRGK